MEKASRLDCTDVVSSTIVYKRCALRTRAWQAVDSLFPRSLGCGPHPFFLLRFQGYNSGGSDSRTPVIVSHTQTRSSVITMAVHAPLALPHAAAGPRLAAPLLTPAATAPSLRRPRCPRSSLVNQQRRMRHLLPAVAAAKPGAIGNLPPPSLTLVDSIMLSRPRELHLRCDSQGAPRRPLRRRRRVSRGRCRRWRSST